VFERFNDRARQVVVLAQEEARILKHNYIGTEHILLGLLREEKGIAARVLESLDITIERVRAEVVRVVGSGEEGTSGAIPFTPRAKKVLELALREALSLAHNYIGTEHLLLGLVRENEGVAARILVDFDADDETIRQEVLRTLETGGGEPPPTARGERIYLSGHDDPSRVRIGGPVPSTAQVPVSDAAQAVLGRAAMEALANGRTKVAARDLLAGLMASDTTLGTALRTLVESDAAAAKTLREILEQGGPYPD
jgi:hypothetical protein